MFITSTDLMYLCTCRGNMASESGCTCLISVTVYLTKVISPVSALQFCSLWSKFSFVFGNASTAMSQREHDISARLTYVEHRIQIYRKTFTVLTCQPTAKGARYAVSLSGCVKTKNLFPKSLYLSMFGSQSLDSPDNSDRSTFSLCSSTCSLIKE